MNFRPEHHILNLIPFNWSDDKNQLIVEAIPNIIMFVPLGFFIPVILKNNRKLYKTTAMIFVLTFSKVDENLVKGLIEQSYNLTKK